MGANIKDAVHYVLTAWTTQVSNPRSLKAHLIFGACPAGVLEWGTPVPSEVTAVPSQGHQLAAAFSERLLLGTIAHRTIKSLKEWCRYTLQ